MQLKTDGLILRHRDANLGVEMWRDPRQRCFIITLNGLIMDVVNEMQEKVARRVLQDALEEAKRGDRIDAYLEGVKQGVRL